MFAPSSLRYDHLHSLAESAPTASALPPTLSSAPTSSLPSIHEILAHRAHSTLGLSPLDAPHSCVLTIPSSICLLPSRRPSPSIPSPTCPVNDESLLASRHCPPTLPTLAPTGLLRSVYQTPLPIPSLDSTRPFQPKPRVRSKSSPYDLKADLILYTLAESKKFIS